MMILLRFWLIVEEPLISDGKAVYCMSDTAAAPTLFIAVILASAILTAVIALIVEKKK